LITPPCLSLFTSDPTSDYFNSKKIPGFRLGGCGIHVLRECFLFFSRNFVEKTLQLFVPNSKRLGGYTQWVHFFAKSALHLEVLTRTFQGFSSEITWINLVSTRKNLEEQKGS
jgi:hypothetical protein